MTLRNHPKRQSLSNQVIISSHLHSSHHPDKHIHVPQGWAVPISLPEAAVVACL